MLILKTEPLPGQEVHASLAEARELARKLGVAIEITIHDVTLLMLDYHDVEAAYQSYRQTRARMEKLEI